MALSVLHAGERGRSLRVFFLETRALGKAELQTVLERMAADRRRCILVLPDWCAAPTPPARRIIRDLNRTDPVASHPPP